MTRFRLVLATVGLAALVGLAGCSTLFGGGGVDPGALSKDADYDWETDADAYLEVNRDNYTSVYNASAKTTGNDTAIAVYTHDTLGMEVPLEVAALQFRYRNGTVLRYEEGGNLVADYPNGTTGVDVPDGRIGVATGQRRTKIRLPTTDGQVAFTAPKNGKRVSTPTFVEGSYVVVLPANTDVRVPLLGSTRPGGASVATRDGRVHIRWESVGGPSVSVRYYLIRDLLLFGGIGAGLVVLGVLGAGYFLLQIRETVRKREEVGLDVEVEDDDREPPPGFG